MLYSVADANHQVNEVAFFNWVTFFDNIESIGTLLIGISTVIISIYLFRQQTSANKVNTHHAMLESYNSLIKLGLSSNENLLLVKSTFYHNYSDEDARQLWVVLMAMNTLEHVVIAKRYQGLNPDLADGITYNLMKELLKNPHVESVLARGTIDKELIDIADRIKIEIKADINETTTSRE